MNSNKFDRDVFGEVFLAGESTSITEYKTLNEEMKNSMTKSVADVILGRAKELFGSSSYTQLSATKGRFSTYKSAKEISQSLDYLTSQVANAARTSVTTDQRDYMEIQAYAAALKDIQSFLMTNESRFAEHFDDEIVQYAYMTLASTLAHGVNSMILQVVDYVKGEYGGYTVLIKKVKLSGDVVLSTAMSLAFHIRSGKMGSMFATSGVTESLDMTSIMKGLSGSYEKAKKLAASPVLRGLGYASAFFVILINIRDIVFYFLKSSDAVSKWAESRALYLEMNAKNISGRNPVSAEKQRAVAEKFRKMADMFSLENRATSNEVNREVSFDNRSLSTNMSSAGNDGLL